MRRQTTTGRASSAPSCSADVGLCGGRGGHHGRCRGWLGAAGRGPQVQGGGQTASQHLSPQDTPTPASGSNHTGRGWGHRCKKEKQKRLGERGTGAGREERAQPAQRDTAGGGRREVGGGWTGAGPSHRGPSEFGRGLTLWPTVNPHLDHELREGIDGHSAAQRGPHTQQPHEPQHRHLPQPPTRAPGALP